MRRVVVTLQTRDAHHAAIEAMALAWLVRLRSGRATVADAKRFLRWRMQSVEHAQVVQRLALTWHVLGRLKQPHRR
jgi:ferric-dicitrate binding protein FerR (iron transport regulator)